MVSSVENDPTQLCSPDASNRLVARSLMSNVVGLFGRPAGGNMFVLSAQGPSPRQVDSWEISAVSPVLLGQGADRDCPVPWDTSLAPIHAELKVVDSVLTIRCLSEEYSPIWKDGRGHQSVQLNEGDSFRVGQTWFSVATTPRELPVVGLLEKGKGKGDGSEVHTTNVLMSPADIRMSMVSDNAASLWRTTNDKELAKRSLEVLNQVLTEAELLVVISCKRVKSASRPRIVHWHKHRSGVKATVSRELIEQAIGEGETAVEVESDALGEPTRSGRWSFCVPVKSDAEIPWCIYVGGSFGDSGDYGAFLRPEKLRGDASLTQLVAHLLGAVRSVRSMENRFNGVRQFFSPRLLDTVVGGDTVVYNLVPRETDVTVIYCDLRGFSRMVSSASHDLHGLLGRISAALGVMTQSIIELDGVIADFQGDSALGFWGWPIALSDGPLPACRAALKIQRIFQMAADSGDPQLQGFNVGIGIACGRAIAGRIGTRDHAKIGVFGPVVNVASRLEGLTRQVGASILMDRTTAEAVREEMGDHEGRVRPIGTIQPPAFAQPIDVSELLPPPSESRVSNEDIDTMSKAVGAFCEGEWDQCRQLLGQLPADDRPRDFLLVQIASQGYQAPDGWSGVIRTDHK